MLPEIAILMSALARSLIPTNANVPELEVDQNQAGVVSDL